ncbi:hypothetical protein OG302_01735 [Streptomyces sp. NBC_01283]|uniref:hypothetical protein n=1 Tax=Streptomyces sp. NBC_01283 TaxID=2903812 RepID=UPI00352E5C2C|nr:hypothetical protein OG302_01735 [Streptomyces sp. NBC_01283]
MTGRFCWHCDQPITQGQPTTTFVMLSIAAGGAAVTLHEKCAERAGYVRRHP